MIELLQTSLQVAWGLLLQIPMPWRFLLALFMTLFGIPWVMVRGLPWIIAKFSLTILFLINYLAIFILLLENLLSQYIRHNGSEPPVAFYLLGRLIGTIVSLFDLAHKICDNILKYALTRQWLLERVWLLVISIVFSIVWSFQFSILNYSQGNQDWKFPMAKCGDPNPPGYQVFYPVFVNRTDDGVLNYIKNNYCSDAYLMTRSIVNRRSIQIASFQTQKRAFEFSRILIADKMINSAEVGLPTQR